MSLTAQVSAGYEEAVKQAAAANAALPAGEYNVTLATGEVKPFAKDNANYANKNALNITLRIADGQFAGRTLRGRIPLFDRWNPSAKYPDGYPIREYGQFFKAVGASQEQINSGNLPPLDVILGKPLSVRVKYITPEEQPERAEYNTNEDGIEVPWNEISRYAAGTGAAPAATVPAEVWGAAPAAPTTSEVWAPTGPSL